jgi:NTP pyrophosphatase (non-canonical NTP hydrolase)
MDGGDGERFCVLGEEVGEVARAILERAYGDGSPVLVETWEQRLRDELVQVAAVSVAWIEAIDTRGGS